MNATVQSGLRAVRAAGLALAVVLPAGCGQSNPVSPETGPTSSTEFFTGSLGVGGVASYAFTVTQEGALQVTLTELNSTPVTPQPTPVALGFGIPAGDGCAVSTSVPASPGLTSQILQRPSAGIYCIEIRDTGSLTAAVSFAVRIVHP